MQNTIFFFLYCILEGQSDKKTKKERQPNLTKHLFCYYYLGKKGVEEKKHEKLSILDKTVWQACISAY